MRTNSRTLSTASKRYALIAVVGVGIAFAFNNCGTQNDFAMTQEGKLEQLNASGGITINEDAEFTNSGDVILKLEHNSAAYMYITNSRDCDGGGVWEPMAPAKAWKLGQNNGSAEVFVKFREQEDDDLASYCVSDSIVHDDIAPVISVPTKLSGFINKIDASADFSVSDAGAGVDSAICSVDSSSASCENKIGRAGLSEGTHTMKITARDRAGNVATPVEMSFTVDITPPSLILNSVPSLITNQTNSIFKFAASDAISGIDHYECRNGASFASCASPWTITLAAGPHDVAIRAIDRAGNSSAEQSYRWTIDLAAPTVLITKSPDAFSNVAVGVVEFRAAVGPVAIERFECSVDGGAKVACTSPYSTRALSEGSHTISIEGISTAGNRSKAPAIATWTVDLSPPVLQLVSKPEKNAASTSANFAFSATDAVSSVTSLECQLDGAAFAACTSPLSKAGLNEGDHTFMVRATDAAGNQASTALYTWRIDVTAPTVKITSGPSDWVKSKSASFAFTAADPNGSGIARIECQLDSGAFAACTSPNALANLPEGQHLFNVRSFDNAGNVSVASADSTRIWGVDTMAPAINFDKRPLTRVQRYASSDIQFSVADAGSGIQSIKCGLAGTLVDCTASKTLAVANAQLGSFTYTVKAIDKLGNEAENSISWMVVDDSIEKNQPIVVTASSNKKVDVLVIIDNSGSMDTEQASMASRFNNFITQLNGLDWQLAIVTTDVSADAKLKDGRFVEFSKADGTASGKFVLTSAMPINDVKTLFANTIQRPKKSEGSGAEQGIAATVRAVQRSQLPDQTVNSPNVSFFRTDSAFSAIVVTDSNETNYDGTKPYNTPEFLLNLIKATWPSKAFSYHSIVVKDGDVACKKINGNEAYGISYIALSNLTGGVVGSVCETDYGTQLSVIGQSTTTLINAATLSCVPLDTNGDGKPDVTVTHSTNATLPAYTIAGTKLTFASALPSGTTTLKYRCLQ